MKKSEKIILIVAIIIGIVIIIQNCNHENGSENQSVAQDTVEKIEKNIIKEEHNKCTYLEAEYDDISFLKSGGSKSVRINTDAEYWEVESSSSWLSLSKKGKTLNVSCTKNGTGRKREQKIIIKAGNISTIIFASQTATPTQFSLDCTKIVTDMSGGCYTINVDTDVDNWYAICYTGGLTLNKDGDKLNICIPQLRGDSRSWQIVVNGEFEGATRFSQIINVRQKGYCFSCHGAGRIQCGICHGSGKQMNYASDIPFLEPCYSCQGNGYFHCSSCDGTGLSKD